MRLVSFGDYQLPQTQVNYSDNFRDIVQQTVRLPGRDGGFDYYGTAQAPKEIGNVRVGLWIFGDSRELLRAKLDELYGMIPLGQQRLVIDPQDDTGTTRYCLAKVSNIQASESVQELPHKRQLVTINWQVAAEPYWIGEGTEDPLWGQVKWNQFYWGGTAPTYVVSGTSTDITITNAGSAPAVPRLTITVGSAETIENVKVRRIVGGVTMDEVGYTGTLTGTNTLDINCRTLAVTLNGTAAYGNLTFTRGYWMKLEPGDNTLRVVCDNSGDAASLKVRYQTRFY